MADAAGGVSGNIEDMSLSRLSRFIRDKFSRGFSQRLESKRPAGKYTTLKFDDGSIERGAFKQHLGGSAEQWEMRGRFQLDWLCSRGLKSNDRLLDIGCGPLRAGVHFIRYLDRGRYCGVDYNADFIRIAKHSVMSDLSISSKDPTLSTIRDFDFSDLGKFDFAICWSVLNHCDEQQRDLFWTNVGGAMAPGGRIFISHAASVREVEIAASGFVIERKLENCDGLKLEQYGWQSAEQKTIAPLYECVRR